jgi:cytidine deaminase
LDSTTVNFTMSPIEQALLNAAVAARLHAYPPFSGFQVGAALLTKSGKTFTGCNIENSSYGLTICAERVALFKAISEGFRPTDFQMLMVVAEGKTPTPPCGACRQVVSDLCDAEMPILLANLDRQVVRRTVAELFPHPFGSQYFR